MALRRLQAVWTCLSRHRVRAGRNCVSKELRELIFRMVAENPTWGAPRIHGELKMLGFDISERTAGRRSQLPADNLLYRHDGLVKSIHAGYSGPATGDGNSDLRHEVKALVVKLLSGSERASVQ